MGDFFKSTRFKILLGVLILLLFFMLRAAYTGGLSPLISQALGLIVTPLQRTSSAIADSVGGFFQRYTYVDQIAKQNDQLQEEVNQLRAQLVELEQFRQENASLREFLDIKQKNPDFALEPAAIVARDPNDRFYSITVDKGTLDGVSLRDPVISPEGLVGVVNEVGLNWAKVLTILDVGVNAGAYDVRTRDIGIVTGDIHLAAEGMCKLSYLPRESGASVGDLVVTTGGGLFPKDLVIGKISDVAFDKGEVSLYAQITPTADIRGLTDVMIIKSFNGQEEVQDDQ